MALLMFIVIDSSCIYIKAREGFDEGDGALRDTSKNLY